VANRSEASAQAVAKTWDIADVMTDWRALVQREDIDAVLIGNLALHALPRDARSP
jgi:predicted dehydrogenase